MTTGAFGRPLTSVSLEVGNVEPARQVAALAWRLAETGVDVLLVTSRISGRWLLPKGWPMQDLTAAQSAAQEAFEEAGVRGEAVEQPIGCYRYDKVLKDGSVLPCHVDVFAIHTGGLLDDWPEKMQRQRRWYSAPAAAKMVTEPDLARFLRDCEGLVGHAPQQAVE